MTPEQIQQLVAQNQQLQAQVLAMQAPQAMQQMPAPMANLPLDQQMAVAFQQLNGISTRIPVMEQKMDYFASVIPKERSTGTKVLIVAGVVVGVGVVAIGTTLLVNHMQRGKREEEYEEYLEAKAA